MQMNQVKAIALMSGGLDSTLAAKIVKDQGVHVIGLHLSSPFACRADVEKNANHIGVPLMVREKGTAYLDLIENPRYGYGRAMNPCIDCRIFMFQIADTVRRDEGADFVITGEVLGQRPMSQHRHAMDLIEQKSPLQGLVLRPLSAHRLPPTLAEEKGWVDRNKLFDITGRSRKLQLELAKKLGIEEFTAPGGGCLLTEVMFAPKLKDFFRFKEYQSEEEQLAQSELLRYGRHFRVSEKYKVVVSRDHEENQKIAQVWLRTFGTLFIPKDFEGPHAIAFGLLTPPERELTGEMILFFSKERGKKGSRRIAYQTRSELGEFSVVPTLTEERLKAWRL